MGVFSKRTILQDVLEVRSIVQQLKKRKNCNVPDSGINVRFAADEGKDERTHMKNYMQSFLGTNKVGQ